MCARLAQPSDACVDLKMLAPGDAEVEGDLGGTLGCRRICARGSCAKVLSASLYAAVMLSGAICCKFECLSFCP